MITEANDAAWTAIVQDCAFSFNDKIAYRNRDFGDEDESLRPFTDEERDSLFALLDGVVDEDPKNFYENEEDGS